MYAWSWKNALPAGVKGGRSRTPGVAFNVSWMLPTLRWNGSEVEGSSRTVTGPAFRLVPVSSSCVSSVGTDSVPERPTLRAWIVEASLPEPFRATVSVPQGPTRSTSVCRLVSVSTRSGAQTRAPLAVHVPPLPGLKESRMM